MESRRWCNHRSLVAQKSGAPAGARERWRIPRWFHHRLISDAPSGAQPCVLSHINLQVSVRAEGVRKRPWRLRPSLSPR
jgi:hypothetical protein